MIKHSAIVSDGLKAAGGLRYISNAIAVRSRLSANDPDQAIKDLSVQMSDSSRPMAGIPIPSARYMYGLRSE
ncbi:hypothetical protein GCM10023194_22380 [Planotetraspora phitsanulokensis]|uniref:Uncharacterized protein n=1 Tax=Planotetraspora phitsanulokensis TaxID=575192 RepID=A0A8J3UG29_9ACTN|nr:hypothetical protein Pph01_32980 [Planotetraspora phitsanulokensis]